MLDKFNFWADYYEAGRELPKRERLELWDAIVSYAFEGREPALKGATKAVFVALRGRVDASVQGAKNVRKRRGTGKAGEAPSEVRRGNKSHTPSEGASDAPSEAPSDGLTQKTGQPIGTDIDIDKERLSNESPKKAKGPSFRRPTVDEVAAHIAEKGYHFEAGRFVDFYESNGWKVGRNPMRSWKSACSTWESRWRDEHGGSSPKAAKGGGANGFDFSKYGI